MKRKFLALFALACAVGACEGSPAESDELAFREVECYGRSISDFFWEDMQPHLDQPEWLAEEYFCNLLKECAQTSEGEPTCTEDSGVVTCECGGMFGCQAFVGGDIFICGEWASP